MKIKLFTIPNLLTLANLLCGSVAAVAALVWGELTLAFGLVVLAAVFDFFDGFVARLLHQSSPIGLQLDSLADDVSFGFAPAAVMFALYGQMSGVWLPDGEAGLVVFLFTACGALRLARFNIDDTQRTEFLGLPIPAAAMLCASLGMLAETYGMAISREVIVAAALVAHGLQPADVRPQVPRVRLARQRPALRVPRSKRPAAGAARRAGHSARRRALRPRVGCQTVCMFRNGLWTRGIVCIFKIF